MWRQILNGNIMAVVQWEIWKFWLNSVYIDEIIGTKIIKLSFFIKIKMSIQQLNIKETTKKYFFGIENNCLWIVKMIFAYFFYSFSFYGTWLGLLAVQLFLNLFLDIRRNLKKFGLVFFRYVEWAIWWIFQGNKLDLYWISCFCVKFYKNELLT